MQDICTFYFLETFALYEGTLLFEIILVVVVFKKIFILLSDEMAIFGVLDEHGHEGKDIDSFEVQIILTCEF